MIIYMVKFPNNKMYIGKTINKLETRRSQHKCDMLRDNNNKAFYNAIKKYGWDNLIWSVIDTSETEEELLKRECFWISHYNTYIHSENPMGYNSTLGGEGMSGYRYSKEAKKRMSENSQGEGNPFYGRKHSEEAKQKQSESKIGKYKDSGNPNYGNSWSEEQKQHISELNKGRLLGENNPSIIITEAIAKEIKIELSKGIKISEISKKINVPYDVVRNIKLLKCWRELLPELNDEIIKFKQKRTKISLETAKNIKIRLSNGEDPYSIIEELGVTKDNVFNIKYLKNYKTLLPELNEKIKI